MKIFTPVLLILICVSGLAAARFQDLDNDPAKVRQRLIENDIERYEEEVRHLQLKARQHALENEKGEKELERLRRERQKVLERRHREKLLGQVARFPSTSQGAKVAERKLQELMNRYKNAKTDEKRDVVKNEIRNELTSAYTRNLEAYDNKITQMRERLSQMEKHLESHRNAMDDMVELRLEWVTKNAELGELPPVGLFDRVKPEGIVGYSRVKTPPTPAQPAMGEYGTPTPPVVGVSVEGRDKEFRRVLPEPRSSKPDAKLELENDEQVGNSKDDPK